VNALLEFQGEIEVELTCAFCENGSGEECARCAMVCDRVRDVLLESSDALEGNVAWALAGALARVVGAEHVDWDAVRELAAEFEPPYGPN
jgi:hypothetical protein